MAVNVEYSLACDECGGDGGTVTDCWTPDFGFDPIHEFLRDPCVKEQVSADGGWLCEDCRNMEEN